MAEEDLLVRSNIARDILGTADDFASVPKMIVEYVSNGLDNPNEPSDPVAVQVTVGRPYGGRREITVTDDGSGMDHHGLNRFFHMHSENYQRQRGRRARGRFGTGKSAAFGVGTSLRLDTVLDGRRRRVRLSREELAAAAKENRDPVVEKLPGYGEPTDAPNGTTVTVTGVRKRADQDAIANALRNQLGRQVETHTVLVNGQRVRLHEPTPVRTWRFPLADDAAAATELADEGLACVVNAVRPGEQVDEALRGVIVTSREVPVGQYFAPGDHGARLWGVCEVPALDADTTTPGPFTDRRDMTLNLDNTTAAAVVGWVQRCLERATRELAEEERDRRRRARDEQLARAAERAEAILNEHFRTDFRIASGAGTGGGSSRAPGSRAGEIQPDPDGEAVVPHPHGTAGYQPPEPPDPPAPGAPQDDAGAASGQTPDPTHPSGAPRHHERDPLAEGRGDPATALERRRRRPRRGGFQIDYSNEGPEAPRAQFLESDLTIVINMDHPMLAASRPGDDLFQGLAFNAAAEEYAQYTTNRLVELGQLDIDDAFEALQRMRTTMEQLTRAFAEVFSTLAPAA